MDADYVYREMFDGNCYELYWTNPGSNIPQSGSFTATDLPSFKPSKLEGQDRRDTAGEVRTNSKETSSYTFSRTSYVGRPRKTYPQQLCTDTVCSLEDLQGALDDRDEWRKRVKETRAIITT